MGQNNAKVALITGASRGIGLAIAERLARDGFKLIINYSASAAPAEQLVAKLEGAGSEAIAIKADVSDPRAVREMFDAAETTFGGVDVLINNAGIMARASIAETDDASFDRHIAINLKGMFNTLTGRNSAQVEAVTQYANEHQVDLRAVEMDVAIDASCDAAIRRIIAEHGHLDVVIHNAGHMSLGPAEAFTPQQFAELYDVNVLSTQRVNRAALPQLRKQRKGLIVSVSSSSTRGGTPPYLSPYFAAKAAMDSLAVSYASELTRWGIEEPADADAGSVAAAIVNVVNTPFGKRPFRVHVDPSQDGAEIVNGVADRVRAEMFRRIGLEDLLHPAVTKG